MHFHSVSFFDSGREMLLPVDIITLFMYLWGAFGHPERLPDWGGGGEGGLFDSSDTGQANRVSFRGCKILQCVKSNENKRLDRSMEYKIKKCSILL